MNEDSGDPNALAIGDPLSPDSYDSVQALLDAQDSTIADAASADQTVSTAVAAVTPADDFGKNLDDFLSQLEGTALTGAEKVASSDVQAVAAAATTAATTATTQAIQAVNSTPVTMAPVTVTASKLPSTTTILVGIGGLLLVGFLISRKR